MTDNMLDKNIALRIGLAARELPDTEPSRLMKVLLEVPGLPLTDERLSTLKLKDLKQAQDGELAEIDTASLKKALACLRGESVEELAELPAIESFVEGDMPGSIRIACASNKAELADGHFGSCARFLIYQVSRDEARLMAIRSTKDAQGDDKNAWRASLLQDCQILFVASIGGPAAAKVVRAGVHPIKRPEGGPARAAIAEIQERLSEDQAAPWLAKAMGVDTEKRVRFESESVL
jgi:nitrogen fixation protein NifX